MLVYTNMLCHLPQIFFLTHPLSFYLSCESLLKRLIFPLISSWIMLSPPLLHWNCSCKVTNDNPPTHTSQILKSTPQAITWPVSSTDRWFTPFIFKGQKKWQLRAWTLKPDCLDSNSNLHLTYKPGQVLQLVSLLLSCTPPSPQSIFNKVVKVILLVNVS